MTTELAVRDLVSLVERGEILEAFDRYYADDVAMAENAASATVGKATNRAREEAFLAGVATVHENRAASVLVDGDHAAIRWLLDFTNREGTRLRFDQIALQTWRDGRISEERFYYDSASLVQGEPAPRTEEQG